MSRYHIIATKSFLRDLERIDSRMRKRMEQALLKLQEDPYSGRKLVSIDVGRWRLRVEDYRIRYDVDGKIVILHRVRHRKDIYR